MLFDTGTAEISDDAMYRYWLTRELGGQRPLVIIGNNPSVADASKDDPTIRKECGFARRWHCGRLVKANAAGYRATKPADLKRARKAGVDVIGPGNRERLQRAVRIAVDGRGILLVAWGANVHAIGEGRQRELADLIEHELEAAYPLRESIGPFCLGTNDDGSPVHPLYVPYDRVPVLWRCP